ncbi:MAG: adenylate/guanylate cyclase domain-containing protein [Spirochaetaceae bacterium]|jgi:class 3 adenylate cyclase/CHASE2 domain-containing sensor protein|nr:adenylate/guanylate cyclase domain-containing protein [Spirochaetaceae bacterium]
MAQKKRSGNKTIATAALTAFIGAASVLLNAAGAFEYLELKTYDFRVRLLAGMRRPSDDIRVVLLDQASIDWANAERGWSWPWPRKAYAEFVDYMDIGGARAVAFDVIFSEPSVYRNARQDEIIDRAVERLEQAQTLAADSGSVRQAGSLFRDMAGALRELSSREDDASFARAAGNSGRVVQTVFFSTQSGNRAVWPEDLDKPLFNPAGFGPLLERFDLAYGYGDTEGNRPGAQFPIPPLRASAGVLGTVTGLPDSDSIIRRMKLFTLFDGRAVPGLSAAALLVSGADRNISYDAQSGVIQWEGYRIPVDKNGASLLRFRGDIDQYTYIPYHASEILSSAEQHARGEAPLYPPEDFRGKYIFFGYYAPGLFDICSTPISSVYPGMGVHITMLDNILQQDFICELPAFVPVLLILSAVILMNLLVFSSGKIPVAVGGGALILALLAALGAGGFALGYWIPVVAPMAAVILALLASSLYSYATEGSQRRFIKSAFSQYLSPAVIDRIIADPSQLKLGGEKRDMTAIFTDIRSFSTISEALGDPAKLVELLNFYLTRMSNIVLENQGTIDKYEGDAIIAFFGAPVYTEEHARLACRSAVMMKKAEAEINREVLAQGLVTRGVMEAMVRKGILATVDDPAPVYTRLGINSGDMVVGNMGTPNKMDYTIMGNAVNLAARLEGVNKQYHTNGILISEYTRERIGDDFVIRPLSRVRVVGVNTPLRLYELLDLREGAPETLLGMASAWERALRAYEARDFLAARNGFETVRQKNGADGAAGLYIDRCEKYLASPPPEETWEDGVDNLTEK